MNIKPRVVLSVLLFLVTLTPAVWAQVTPTAQTTPSNPLQTLAEGNNTFGMDLFHQLGKSVPDGKNLVFSPYSISSALAMAWTGARKNTEAQMAQVLHFTGGRETIGQSFHQLRDGLEEAGKDGGFELGIANSLWLQKDFKLLQPFLDGLDHDFNAPPQLVDFQKEPEPARLGINQWVEDKTKQKIKDLIPPGAFDKETFMVLVNAVYFKADWLNAFKPGDTKQLPFHFSAENSAPISMMQQQKVFRIAEDDQAQVLELPYKGDQLSMDVILPKNAQGLPDVEQKLDSAGLKTWLSKMSNQTVDVKLPKFKMTFGTVQLNPFLEGMGMPEAFDKHLADFTGMAKIDLRRERIYIQKVFHKAFVNVDEKGTEAAAATAVVVAHACSVYVPIEPKIILFNADHPFIFLIRDKQTNSILFIGRVADPRSES